MKAILRFGVLLLVLFAFSSCEKDDSNPNALGGDVNIVLTEPGNTTAMTLVYGGLGFYNSTMTVKTRDNGKVRYELLLDLAEFPDSLKVKALGTLNEVKDYYKLDTNYTITPDNKLKIGLDLKVTSDGWADYFTEGKEWVVGKYADGVGTKYTVTRDNGEVLTRTVTEKTGQDDFPYGFLLIKTSKIEEIAATDNPLISKVTFRLNHKFGLVALTYQMKDGEILDLRMFPDNY